MNPFYLKNAKLLFTYALLIQTNCFAQTPKQDFAKYSTPKQNIQCKELDYSSYHKTEAIKSSLKKSNPDLNHPNFAGKYLLLRNDYLFETLWFVADCSTGKFIKDSLSTDHKKPSTEFNSESSLVLIQSLDQKNPAPIEYHAFQNEKWARVAIPTTTSVSPNPSPTTSLSNNSATTPAPQNEEFDFSQYPAQVNNTCKELDFDSYSRAQAAKGNLLKDKPDLSKPNFAGRYYLLQGETIAHTYWLIADCNTGKFLPEMLTGSGLFQKDSHLFKVFNSGKFPTYYVWNADDAQWIKLHGSNSIYTKSAMKLYEALPNPEKSSNLKFENLICSKINCVIDMGNEKGKPISGSNAESLISLTSIWGINNTIKSGVCKDKNGKISCEIEN